MYRTVSAALSLALAASATLAVTPEGAAAVEGPRSRTVLHDATGDVRTYAPGDADAPAPSVTSYPAADVTAAVVTHGHHALRIRLRFADLQKVGHQAYRMDLRTPRALNETFYAAVVSGPGTRQGRHFLERGSSVRCPGFEHQIDYETNVVIMRIPRRCLRRPRWVRVHLDNALWTGDGQLPDAAYEDNPHSDDANAYMFTRRLYRG
jgi:hypothetical protein